VLTTVAGREAQTATVEPGPSARARAARNALAHPSIQFGGAVVLAIVLACFLSPLFMHGNPDLQNPLATFLPPSWAHPFGTDDLGRGVLERVLYGGRYTIVGSVVAVLIGVIGGLILGVVAGYSGGMVDMVIMRAMDIVLAFPGILSALAITAILGPSLVNTVIAIGVSGIPGFCRIMYASTVQARTFQYVEAARAEGSSVFRMLQRHVLPAVFAQVIVSATTGLGISVLSIAALGFLGLGVQPPTPEWGAILNEGQQFLQNAWWIAIFPGIFITLFVIGVNLVGDGLRDVLDPTLRGKG
jgi:ABC-type dipeptide/oligopeptide/nickel transport system permease subunit